MEVKFESGSQNFSTQEKTDHLKLLPIFPSNFVHGGRKSTQGTFHGQ